MPEEEDYRPLQREEWALHTRGLATGLPGLTCRQPPAPKPQPWREWWQAAPVLTVSSVQMECTWVPNMTDVKMRKSSPSKQSKMRRITVVGGEKELHSEREWTRGARGSLCLWPHRTGFLAGLQAPHQPPTP